MNRFYSNGKLLLTGEYVVLDGAIAFALPTIYGQSLTLESIEEQKIIWHSFNADGTIWFESEFIYSNGEILNQIQNETPESKRLLQILNAIKHFNPTVFDSDKGFHIKTKLDFPKNWGLGTSSTLINNIANWTNIDPYNLLDLTFKGSGYDIACAQNNQPITYQLKNDQRIIKAVNFNPKFIDSIYFVHLNKKQNSREGITQYKKSASNNLDAISEISDITLKIIDCNNLNEFENLVNKHEQIISSLIKQDTIKDLLFKNFIGSIKSLGAWGGDFVLVTSTEDPSNYFKSKGFNTIIPYKNIILNHKKNLAE